MALKKILPPLALGLVFSLLMATAYVVGTPFMDLMELKAIDALFVLRGPRPMASGSVAVVAVNEKSLTEEGRWPWPREKVARLILEVHRLGARAVGLDMGFFEPDNRFNLKAVRAVVQAARQGKKISLREVALKYHPDVVLARALAQLRGQAVLGYYFHMSPVRLKHLDREQIKARRRALAPFSYPAVRYKSEAALDFPLLRAYAPENNQPVLLQAVRAAGYFNVLPDPDGVVRRIPLVLQCGDKLFPPLSLATLARFLDRPLPVVTVHDYGLEGIRLGDIPIPTDEKGRMWINFRGAGGAVKVLEASDVLRNRVPAGALKGKVVLIGVAAVGLFDVKATPFAAVQPGVEVQAQVMDNILAGDFLVRPGWSRLFDLLGIAALGLAAALILGTLRPLWGWPLALALGAAYLLAGYRLFLAGRLINLIYPPLALLLSGVGLTLYRYLTEEREKKWIRHAFQHYLSPSVINEVTREPGKLSVGGEKKVLTVLFSDIRGFTTISEGLEPEQLAQMLNTYLDRMTEAVFRYEGVLDKYIGDAVMAIFGAPMEQPDHASRACDTALSMLEDLEVLNAQWEREGLPLFRIGVGVNTGPMVVGNMGSSRRFDYTVLGDNVNLGSRLEGLTKGYGVPIIASQSTREAAEGSHCFRILDLVRVKGKHKPVAIYELVGPRNGGPQPDFVALAQEAFNAYLARDFAQAAARFQRILEIKPGDTAAGILLQRCRELMANPPDQSWDGAITKKEK